MTLFENISLKKLVSYNAGGTAQFYCEPSTADEFVEAVRHFRDKNCPIFLLGRGSNILVSDRGIEGAVINTSSLNSMEISGTSFRVDAGVLLSKAVMKTVTAGLAGMEDLAGIPGSLGGGVIMNAGAYTQTISDRLVSVTWLDLEECTLHQSPKSELTFGYRTSWFKNRNCAVLDASFELAAGDAAALREKVLATQEKRRTSQPLNYPSCGSVFKRPEGNYAGALIEAAGLKGYHVGDAEVSVKHANFIINRGDASAEEIRTCISDVRRKVYEHSGILLEPEVIFVGKFDSELFSA